MATTEERRKILQMVADGTITAAEAADLIGNSGQSGSDRSSAAEGLVDAAETAGAGVEESARASEQEERKEKSPPVELPPTGDKAHRWLRVRVDDMKSGQRKVAVNVPLGLVQAGLTIGRGFSPELERIDWSRIDEILQEQSGLLVEVQDEEDGEHVRIYVE